ncbi:MAG: aminoacyl-tRNA hydrolase [Anaerolineae bacterium]|nr:aminoacyl-tRNA hydrolase [Anaerolineae bacterium]
MGKYLIVGLGNPGREYQSNRHNVGFQVVDHLAARHGLAFSKLQAKAFVTSGHIAGRQVILAKPQSYMNLSGGPVASLHKFYKTEVECLLVVCDDLDLPVGTLRLRPSGGSGGQKGMKSIIERLGSEDFPRLRIGIDRPPGQMDPAAYVLRDFDKEQLPIIQETYSRAADAIETWLADGIELAMSHHNGPATFDI